MEIIPQDSRLPTNDFPAPLANCSYLPIANFKTGSRKFFRGNKIVAKFLSSGTTGQQRAISYFSRTGLRGYRAVAVHCFARVLASYWQQPLGQGLSMITNNRQSSLATMIGWFAQKWPIQFVDK